MICHKAGDPKFPLGLDINTYKELAFEIIKKQYSWATMDIIENSNFKPGIEILDGYFEYITYSGDNWYYVDYNSGTAAIKWIVDCYRREVVETNKIIDSYEVPFYPHSDEHYHLEKYVFNLLTSGDYSLVQQEGDRCTGGACSGALLVLGLKYGQCQKDDLDSRTRANQKTVEFLEQFEKENGSYICNDLLGCDISTVEGVQYAMEHNCFTEICPKMVASAVKILEEMG